MELVRHNDQTFRSVEQYYTTNDYLKPYLVVLESSRPIVMFTYLPGRAFAGKLHPITTPPPQSFRLAHLAE